MGEMDLDEFRRAGHRIVNWIAELPGASECYPSVALPTGGGSAPNFQEAGAIKSIECILNDFERL